MADLTLAQIGIWGSGIRLWSYTIEKEPGIPFFYNNRGSAYVNSGQYDLSIADYSVAIDGNPLYAEAYKNRGIAYLNKRDYQLALPDLRRACDLRDQQGCEILVAVGKELRGER
jgi:tetratricopeptide (TPR) repeat protein